MRQSLRLLRILGQGGELFPGDSGHRVCGKPPRFADREQRARGALLIGELGDGQTYPIPP